MKKLVLTYFFLFLLFLSKAQKILIPSFTSENIIIDGNLDDWNNANWVDDFIQYEPFNSEKPSEQTFVAVRYNDYGLFIAAKVFYKNYKIFKYLSAKDDLSQADFFGFYLDTYNSGISGYGFFMTAVGVKVDLRVDNTNLNYSWDGIWYGNTKISDTVVYYEFFIPFKTLKFSQAITTWRINFYRSIQQLREIDTWNYVDNSKNGILNQMGFLKDIKIRKKPTNLFIIPHFSAIVQKYTNSPKIAKSILGGLDLKYNFSQTATLDMMLIPDFGELTSDDKILNLSPFETFYPEKRPFFTEGMELFNKGNIFYSRRIGKVPQLYDQVQDKLFDNEVIVVNPSQTPIINATKLTLKTKKIGFGLLNALTSQTFAVILDTITGKTRTIRTETFINYNVLTFNLPLPYNSYFSFTNTNVDYIGDKHVANVSAFEGLLKNPNNSFQIFFNLAFSQIYLKNQSPNIGHLLNVSLKKISGNFRFGLSNKVISDNYDPNDLGYLKQNNIIEYSLFVAYNIYKPFWSFKKFKSNLSLRKKFLYQGFQYISTEIVFNSSVLSKSYTTYGIRLSVSPDKIYDYFEPRVEDKFFLKPPLTNFSAYISTNYAKTFAIDLQGGFYIAKSEYLSQKGGWYEIAPRLRISNRFLIVYSHKYHFDFNNFGFVGQIGDSIFFGERDIFTQENTISSFFIFTKNLDLNLKVRHYWTIVDYFNYFLLMNSGKLSPLQLVYRYVQNKDLNFNVFNLDIILTWHFAPASELSLILKKSITASSQNLIYDFYDNFENMYYHYPHLNNISFKLIFYFDTKHKQIFRK